MRKLVLIIVMVVFSLGIIHAQEEEQKEQQAKIDWGWNVALGYGSFSYALNEGNQKGYWGGEIGITAMYGRFIPYLNAQYYVGHHEAEYGSSTTHWTGIVLGTNYRILSWAYLGVNYTQRWGKTTYEFNAENQGSYIDDVVDGHIHGLGLTVGIGVAKNVSLEWNHSWVNVVQEYYPDMSGDIEIFNVRFCF